MGGAAAEIVLTADRALFTDYNGVDALGFGLCLPLRLLPSFLEYMILAPPVPISPEGRASYAPYSLGKVEAALLAAGFRRKDVAIAPPEKLPSIIDKNTEIVGVLVVDPQGLAPVSWTLKALGGGGITATQYEFERLMKNLREIRGRGYGFKIVVGGPGVWQLRGRMDEFGVDVLFDGEAEVTFPILAKDIIDGRRSPRFIVGKPPGSDLIPPIITPSRNGLVEITRGCPRRCHFCSPTMKNFRSISFKTIEKEMEVDLMGGARSISFVTEDVMLYGASTNPLKFNTDAVKTLYSSALKIVRGWGVERIGFSHVTLSSALACRNLTRWISDVNGLDGDHPFLPQTGMESGSPGIVARFFGGKPYPWRAEDWPDVVIEASKLINDNYWYPCYTYIIGFPGSEPRDYTMTTELLDKLKDEGFRGWTFPLLLIPMGGTLIENRADFPELLSLPMEAIEAMVAGLKFSVSFSEWAYPRLVGEIKNPVLRRIALRLQGLTMNALREWAKILERNPESMKELNRVDIRRMRGLMRAAVTSIRRFNVWRGLT